MDDNENNTMKILGCYLHPTTVTHISLYLKFIKQSRNYNFMVKLMSKQIMEHKHMSITMWEYQQKCFKEIVYTNSNISNNYAHKNYSIPLGL